MLGVQNQVDPAWANRQKRRCIIHPLIKSHHSVFLLSSVRYLPHQVAIVYCLRFISPSVNSVYSVQFLISKQAHKKAHDLTGSVGCAFQ